MTLGKIGLAASLVAALACPAAADPAALKFSTTMPAIDPVVKDGVLPMLAAVEKESGGTLSFQSFTGGQLTPNPTKQYDAMASGLDDITIIVASYVPRDLPELVAVRPARRGPQRRRGGVRRLEDV